MFYGLYSALDVSMGPVMMMSGMLYFCSFIHEKQEDTILIGQAQDQTRQDRMVVRPVVCVRAHYCFCCINPENPFYPASVFNMVAKVKSSSTIRMECGIFMCFIRTK